MNDTPAEREIKRYDHGSPQMGGCMEPAEHGDYVRYDDHDATVSALREEAERLSATFPCGHRIADWDNSYGTCSLCPMLTLAHSADEEGHENDRLREEVESARETIKSLNRRAQLWRPLPPHPKDELPLTSSDTGKE